MTEFRINGHSRNDKRKYRRRWFGRVGRRSNDERIEKIGGIRVEENRQRVRSKKKLIEDTGACSASEYIV